MANGLKEIRESCGLKLEDVSRDTCICSRYLEAIEEGDFSKIRLTYTRAVTSGDMPNTWEFHCLRLLRNTKRIWKITGA